MKQFRSMTYPYVLWIAVMIVAPMLLIVLYAFTESGNEVLTFRFTLENFARFVTDSVFLAVPEQIFESVAFAERLHRLCAESRFHSVDTFYPAAAIVFGIRYLVKFSFVHFFLFSLSLSIIALFIWNRTLFTGRCKKFSSSQKC